VVDPVKLISSARSRLAQIAATGGVVCAFVPAIAASVLAVALRPLDQWLNVRFGYQLPPSVLDDLRAGLVAAVIADFVLGVALAIRAWRRAGDLVAAAARVDDLVHARQEIVTLATLTDPSRPSAASERTALFPILWRRAAASLANFDPRRAFRFSPAIPLKRGSALALATVILFGLSMMALVRLPQPEAAQARKLREIARAIESSSIEADSRDLAKALRNTAAALENPKLPPEEKLKILADAMRKLDQQQAKSESAKGNESKGNSSGKGDSGKGGEGRGSGEGKGTGNGSNAEGKSSGSGNGSQQQISDLEKELSKTKAQIESESGPKDKSMPKPSAGEKNGNVLKPGENPNQPGSANQANAAAQNKQPRAGEKQPQTQKPGEGEKQNASNDKGSTKGDTHLGQFPAPVRYERFYKPGEHGPPIEIRDARYVVFRLPSAAISGGGKTVMDTERPVASTPYSNVPLKAERPGAEPDERQPVPPRYRDLIQ
jgi:uncharacterized membrane protein YgcG